MITELEFLDGVGSEKNEILLLVKTAFAVIHWRLSSVPLEQ